MRSDAGQQPQLGAHHPAPHSSPPGDLLPRIPLYIILMLPMILYPYRKQSKNVFLLNCIHRRYLLINPS